MGEHLLCTQEVIGSIPFTSTRLDWRSDTAGTMICVRVHHHIETFFDNLDIDTTKRSVYLCQFCDQAIKGKRWMPWRREAMKDVASCDKPRGAAKQALIRGCLNGETRLE